MTAYDEIETNSRSALSRTVRLLLFPVMQGIAVILVGFAALFLSFQPVWSADDPQAADERMRATLRAIMFGGKSEKEKEPRPHVSAAEARKSG